MAKVTTPGLHPDITEAEYHADPVVGGSLSSSGSKLLTEPSTPAVYRWNAKHPPAPKAVYDFGHVAHKLILGRGETVVVVKADSWRTKVAKEARIEARAAGHVCVLIEVYERAEEMAEVARNHPLVSKLIDRDHGAAEQTIVWRDATTGVMCRARLDWFPDHDDDADSIEVVDYKTAADADIDALTRSFYKFKYHWQDAHYCDGLEQIYKRPARMVFVCQEKEPPYQIAVVQLDDLARADGLAGILEARRIYARCKARDEWPSYPERIQPLHLPAWRERQLTQ